MGEASSVPPLSRRVPGATNRPKPQMRIAPPRLSEKQLDRLRETAKAARAQSATLEGPGQGPAPAQPTSPAERPSPPQSAPAPRSAARAQGTRQAGRRAPLPVRGSKKPARSPAGTIPPPAPALPDSTDSPDSTGSPDNTDFPDSTASAPPRSQGSAPAARGTDYRPARETPTTTPSAPATLEPGEVTEPIPIVASLPDTSPPSTGPAEGTADRPGWISEPTAGPGGATPATTRAAATRAAAIQTAAAEPAVTGPGTALAPLRPRAWLGQATDEPAQAAGQPGPGQPSAGPGNAGQPSAGPRQCRPGSVVDAH